MLQLHIAEEFLQIAGAQKKVVVQTADLSFVPTVQNFHKWVAALVVANGYESAGQQKFGLHGFQVFLMQLRAKAEEVGKVGVAFAGNLGAVMKIAGVV